MRIALTPLIPPSWKPNASSQPLPMKSSLLLGGDEELAEGDEEGTVRA